MANLNESRPVDSSWTDELPWGDGSSGITPDADDLTQIPGFVDVPLPTSVEDTPPARGWD